MHTKGWQKNITGFSRIGDVYQGGVTCNTPLYGADIMRIIPAFRCRHGHEQGGFALGGEGMLGGLKSPNAIPPLWQFGNFIKHYANHSQKNVTKLGRMNHAIHDDFFMTDWGCPKKWSI